MKIIIHYDGVSDVDALMYVKQVVSKGRISNDGKQYCYCTLFNNDAEVYADRTATGTDTFYVVRKLGPDADEKE